MEVRAMDAIFTHNYEKGSSAWRNRYNRGKKYFCGVQCMYHFLKFSDRLDVLEQLTQNMLGPQHVLFTLAHQHHESGDGRR